VLVVPVPDADLEPPLQGVQGVPGVEVAAEDPVGGDEGGNGPAEGTVEDSGPPRGWEVQPGRARLSVCHGCWQASASRGGRCSECGVGTGGVGMDEEQEAGAKVASARQTPLFLPTPDFMASAETE